MAVVWLGLGVAAGAALLRKGSCSIDGNDPAKDVSVVGGGAPSSS